MSISTSNTSTSSQTSGGRSHRDATAAPVTGSHVVDDPVEPGTRRRKYVAGGTMIGAGALSLAGFLLTPWEHGSRTSDYLASLVGQPTRAMIAASVLHFGYVLFVPTAFVLYRLSRRRAPKLSAVGLVLAVIGSGLSGLVVTDIYDLSIGLHVGTHAGAPVSEMTGVPGAMIGFIAMGFTALIGTIFGLGALAAAAWRAKLAPVWPAIGIVAGFLAARGHDGTRGCVAFAVVAVSLAYLGLKVIGLSDREYADR
jgi:hypothetical protein